MKFYPKYKEVEMKLRGIDFGSVMNAAGTCGFFDPKKEYWHHRVFRPFGLNFDGATFVAKTMTFDRRGGNLPLNKINGIVPEEWFPRCLIIKPFTGAILNAVGLSNPGAKFLLEKGEWQKREKPFFLSFMVVRDTLRKKIKELLGFIKLFKKFLPEFPTSIGLEINLSCPNVELSRKDLIEEAKQVFNIAANLDIPLVAKINALVLPETAAEIAAHPACDAIVCSNSIQWGELPEWIDWKGIFGTDVSLFSHLGGGGLSGAPLLPIIVDWLERAKKFPFPKPIIACGGIMSKADIRQVCDAGVSAIQLGSVAILRPWRVAGLIKYANKIFREIHSKSADRSK